jgi:acyl-CoA reductase-like NAD-dependent aldehyde dehydrogenase
MTATTMATAASTTAIDESITAVGRSASTWSTLPLGDKIALLDDVRRRLWARREPWITRSLQAKGMRPATLGEAEEWLYLACVLRAVRRLRSSLGDLDRDGSVGLPGPLRRRANGQLTLRVFPTDHLDRVVYRGYVGHVRFQPGVDPVEVQAGRPEPTGEVAVVLGAGNASMLTPVDVLHQLFVESRTVVVKPSPVNAYLAPLLEDAFAALVGPGYLRFVDGGAGAGAQLSRHPGIDAVHVTGSRATFRAIRSTVDAARVPSAARHAGVQLTAELGNVGPVIVVPGRWTSRELAVQASRLATWLVANAGFGCLTPRVIVQHRRWPQRHAFLQALERALSLVEARPAYYPGAHERHAAFVAGRRGVRLLGSTAATGDDALPWTLVPDVDPGVVDDPCFREEAFCSLVAETALDATTPAGFVDAAVDFANATLWGALNATLVVHPRELRRAPTAGAVARAVTELRYGCVTVNAPAFAAYYSQVLPWGAHGEPDGWTSDEGCGRTANALELHGVEKSVLRGRFHPWPDPVSVTARRPGRFARRLAAFEHTGRVRDAAGVVTAATTS